MPPSTPAASVAVAASVASAGAASEVSSAAAAAGRAGASSSSAAAQEVARRAEQFGDVDILVNNAGVARTGPAEDVTEADWDFVLDTNLKGTFFVAQAFGRAMLSRGSGRRCG